MSSLTFGPALRRRHRGFTGRRAVGDVLGTFVDGDGRPIDYPLNAQALGLDLPRFVRIPRIDLGAAGEHKVAILRAVLTAMPVHGLVTDEITARALPDEGGATG